MLAALREQHCALLKICVAVLVDQFIDRTKRPTEHSFFGRGIVAHIAFADPICDELRQLLLKAAKAEKARVHNGGTYVNMEGPAFSTRAESLANHRDGYDVIGMTNLGEAKCAREAEIAYATMAMVTDYDCWLDDPAQHVSVSGIFELYGKTLAKAAQVLDALLLQPLPEPDRVSRQSLASAMLTPDAALTPEQAQWLSVLRR
jgi:5'-methylthioadenosine phosphorylase